MQFLKPVEVWGRSLGAQGIVSLLRRAGRRAGPCPAWSVRPHRILFLRYEEIGDMILSSGIIRAISEAQPGLRIDVLASPANAPVLRGNPYVSSIIALDRWKPWTYPAVLRRLRAARYDAVVDGMPDSVSFTTLIVMAACGARHRVGVLGRGMMGHGIDEALTIPAIPRTDSPHIVDRLSALIAAFGADPVATDVRPRIYLGHDEAGAAERTWEGHASGGAAHRLLVNVSVGRHHRPWPDEKFVDVIRQARERLHVGPVLVIGSPAERERVERIARSPGGVAVYTPGVRDAFALVSRADAVLTADTSIAHAAAAFQIPAVVLYKKDFMDRWALYRSPGRLLESPQPEIAAISAADVLGALDDLLARVPAVHA